MDRRNTNHRYNIPLRQMVSEKVSAAERTVKDTAISTGQRLSQQVSNAVDDDTVQAVRKTKYYTEDVVGIIDTIAEKEAKKEIFNTYKKFSNQIMAADPRRVGKNFATDRLTNQDYQVFKKLSKGYDYKYDRSAHFKTTSNNPLKYKRAEKLRSFANFHSVEDDLRFLSQSKGIDSNKKIIFTDKERLLLSQDNRIFRIRNQKDFNNLKTLVIKGLDSKGQIAFGNNKTVINNWNKVDSRQLKNLLMDRNVNRDVKAYIQVLFQIKQTEEKLNKIKVPKGKTANLVSKISGLNKLRESDVGQSFTYTQRSVQTGLSVVKTIKMSAYLPYAGSKFVGRQLIKGTNKLGLEKTSKVLETTGKVLTTPERAYKYVKSTPSRIVNKAGEGLRYIGGAAGRRATNTAAGKAVKTGYKKGLKPIGTGINFITKPVRKVANKFLAVIGKLFANFRKILLFCSGGFFIIFVIMIIFMIIALNTGSSSTVSTVILDTPEHFQQYQLIYNNLETEYQGQLDSQIAAGPSILNSKGEVIESYGNPDFAADESDGGNIRNGITVKYLDKNGNQTAASTNIEDLLSIMAVVMQQSMATDEYHYQAAQELIDAYYKSSHLYFVQESPLYPCEKGCIDITYYCNDPYSGDLQYNLLPDIELIEPDYEEDSDTYGCKKSPVWDCDHDCDDPDCEHDCSDSRGGRGCAGYWELYCDGDHVVKGCYGHVDLEMDYIVLSMSDLMDINFDSVITQLQTTYPGIKGSDGTEYHNYVSDWMVKYPDIAAGFNEDGWNEINIDWANALRMADFTEYGITPSYITQPSLTPEEIEQIKENLGDISEVRANIVATAYEGVGVIPYHWDWRNYDSLHPGLADNRFGSSVPADYKNRNKKGLDCSGFVDWVYLTNGISSFGTTNTTGIWAKCEQISGSELQPGDLGFKNIPGTSGGVNHVGIFVGLSDSGQEIWIHCSGSSGCIKSVGYGGFNYYCRFPALD